MPEFPLPPSWVLQTLRTGVVIPAHPLALTNKRALDERHQRALTRYYHAAGVGGIAVGVHTTQFEIRRPEIGLFKPVLQLAAHTVGECDLATNRKTVRIAGICGSTRQALAEARFANDAGYHIGLLSLAGLSKLDDRALVEHARTVASEIPLMGFYLQPAVGGRMLSQNFWRRFVEIPNVVAIKMAPFNRYQTLDVIRAVAESGRANQIALYTGNDDNIVVDLLTDFAVAVRGTTVQIRIVGGLLGHWACWTRKAVELLEQCRRIKQSRVSLKLSQNPPAFGSSTLLFPSPQPSPSGRGGRALPVEASPMRSKLLQRSRPFSLSPRERAGVRGGRAENYTACGLIEMLTLAAQVTDCNAAFFDAAHQFDGCIAGIHEVLRPQGLLGNRLCLDPRQTLSPGQSKEIDRVYRAYPHLNDDAFVKDHLDEWMNG